MGSLFSQQIIRATPQEFAHWARRHKIAVIGSSPAGLMNYRNFPCRWPAALLIGSEKRGLSQQIIDACDFMVRIPMAGEADSINAAIATGVLLYELFHQRRPHPLN